jgi:hypothetical protein
MVAAIQSSTLQNLARINGTFSVNIVEWKCHADYAKKAQITNMGMAHKYIQHNENIWARIKKNSIRGLMSP